MSTVLLFASFFLGDPRVLGTLAIATLALTIRLFRLDPRPGQRRLLTALAASASLGLIVAFTWPITSGNLADLSPERWNLAVVWEGLNPANGGFGTWTHGTDGPLNVLLYVPAGLTVAALVPTLKRAWSAPASLALLSLLTEIWQALDGGRTGQLSDVVANTIGSLMGTAVTVLFRLARALHTSRGPHQ